MIAWYRLYCTTFSPLVASWRFSNCLMKRAAQSHGRLWCRHTCLVNTTVMWYLGVNNCVSLAMRLVVYERSTFICIYGSWQFSRFCQLSPNWSTCKFPKHKNKQNENSLLFSHICSAQLYLIVTPSLSNATASWWHITVWGGELTAGGVRGWISPSD